MYLHSDIVEAFQLAKERVLARKSFSERLMAFLYPESLGIEVAHELERMGLKEEVRRYFRAVENYEIEKLRAQKEYLFWREYKMEELKKELAEDLIEVELIKRKFLGFIPTYDISEGEKLIEKYMEKYPVDDILISLKSIEAQTSGDNKKKAKVVRKKVSRSGGGRKKKIAFSILASGLMIGAAATAGWYWYTHKDTDNDGISDYLETHKYHTDPNNPDTDNDGLNDYQEIFKYRTDPFNPDTDNDGLNDYQEIFKYRTDPFNPDTDNDGLLDGNEVFKYHTDPLKASLFPDTTLQEDIYIVLKNDYINLRTVYCPHLNPNGKFDLDTSEHVEEVHGHYSFTMNFKEFVSIRVPQKLQEMAGNPYSPPKMDWATDNTTVYGMYLDDLINDTSKDKETIIKDSTGFSIDIYKLKELFSKLETNLSNVQFIREINGILLKYDSDQKIHVKSGDELREALVGFNQGDVKALEKALFVLDEDSKILASTKDTTDYLDILTKFLSTYKNMLKGLPERPVKREDYKPDINTSKFEWIISASSLVTMNLADYSDTMLAMLGLLNKTYFAQNKQELKLEMNLSRPITGYWFSVYNSLPLEGQKNFDKWMEYYNDKNDKNILKYFLIRTWVYDTLRGVNKERLFESSDPKKIMYGINFYGARSFSTGHDAEKISFIREIWKKIPNDVPKISEVYDYFEKAGVNVKRIDSQTPPYTVENAVKRNESDCGPASAAVVEVLGKYYPKYIPFVFTYVFNWHAGHHIPLFYYNGTWYTIELWDRQNATEYSQLIPTSVSDKPKPLDRGYKCYTGVNIPFGITALQVPLRDDYTLETIKDYIPDEIYNLFFFLRKTDNNL